MHLRGLKKGVPKQKSLNTVQAVQQEPTEDPSEFLERIFQVYRKYIDLDPQAPENIRMVSMTFISQSIPHIRKKLQELEGGIDMNPSQLVAIAFKVYNNKEQKKAQAPTIFLEQASGQCHQWARGTQPWSKMLATGQCAYCEGKGHWKNACPKRG